MHNSKFHVKTESYPPLAQLGLIHLTQPVEKTLRRLNSWKLSQGGGRICREKPQKIREVVKPSTKKVALLTKKGTHLRERSLS